MRRPSYPTSGYSLGSRRSPQARRLLAAHRRHRARQLVVVGAAFLLVGGTSALASNGGHRPDRDARPPQGAGGLPASGATAQAPAPDVAPAGAGRSVRLRTFSSSWLASHPVPDAPALHARAALAVDVGTGQILLAREPRTRYPTASLAKMMTAMVALDLASLDQFVAVSPAAVAVEPSVMGLSAGERLTVRELLYGLLLDSGNDAAEALAQGIIDRSQFVRRMNQKAVALGLKDTRFANPAGFDDANQFSTAYDLAILSTTLLQDYPELAAIAATRQVSFPASARHKWFGPQNLNRLLWSYPGAIGVKPGFTDGAGYCLAAAATRDGRTVVAVVLGSTRHFSDATALLDFAFRQAAV